MNTEYYRVHAHEIEQQPACCVFATWCATSHVRATKGNNNNKKCGGG